MARTKGIAIVTTLDPVKLAEIYEARTGVKVDPGNFMASGIFYNAAGDMRTICDEGVQDTGGTVGEFTNDFAVYTWSGHLTFTRAELESAVTETKIDAADFIRVFGARLEANFSRAIYWAENSAYQTVEYRMPGGHAKVILGYREFMELGIDPKSETIEFFGATFKRLHMIDEI